MKICLVTEFFYPDQGSTPKLLSELARYLKDHYVDVEIDVITSNNLYKSSGKLVACEDWDGISITRLSTPATNRLPAPLRLLAGFYFAALAKRRINASGDYDLVLVGTNPPFSPNVASSWSRETGKPYVYLIHDLYPDIAVAVGLLTRNGGLTRISRKRQREWLHSAAKVVVLGRCMQDHLAENYGLPRERTEVIPNWADPEEIPLLPKSTVFRRDHGLNGDFVVLYSGNLGHSHGLTEIIDAAKLVQEQRDDVTFVLAGGGAQKEEIAEYIDRVGARSVKMVPPVDYEAYPDLLASADVTLVSLGDGTAGLAVPCKFYSCLAAGRPVISILDQSSEVARVVEESECGLQVNAGDSRALADAVLALRASSEVAESMGANARKALEERFTLAHAAQAYYSVFEAAISGGGR